MWTLLLTIVFFAAIACYMRLLDNMADRCVKARLKLHSNTPEIK